MKRVAALTLVTACLGLLVVDCHLVVSRVGASGVHPLNPLKLAAAAAIQFASFAMSAWSALFLVRRERLPAHDPVVPSLRIKLLPFVAPIVLSMASVILVEIGLFCGDQPVPSVRGRPVCPAP